MHKSKLHVLSLYVDDIIIISDDNNDILVLKTELARQFEVNDLSSLWYFMGIEVVYSHRDYLISHSKYVADILKWTRLIDNKTVDTPFEINT